MKTWPGIAAACVVLSACATTEKPSNGVTMYCWKDRLQSSTDFHTCNWERTAREACHSKNLTPIAAGSVAAGPGGAGRCDNGQWLVWMTTR